MQYKYELICVKKNDSKIKDNDTANKYIHIRIKYAVQNT